MSAIGPFDSSPFGSYYHPHCHMVFFMTIYELFSSLPKRPSDPDTMTNTAVIEAITSSSGRPTGVVIALRFIVYQTPIISGYLTMI